MDKKLAEQHENFFEQTKTLTELETKYTEQKIKKL